METLDISAVLSATKPIVDMVVAFAIKKLTNYQASRKTGEITKRMNARVSDLSEVKTLLNRERSVFIYDFYSTQYLIDSETKERHTVNSPEIFGLEKRIVISGVAGQGKSILLRHLVLHEIARHRLPIFIELRCLEFYSSLDELIRSELKTLGLEGDSILVSHILELEKVVLYLDAFDEVAPSKQPRVRKQIEELAIRFPNLRIFVSSRPNTGIESAASFKVYQLDAFTDPESVQALEKMCDTPEERSKIVSALATADDRIKKTLTTPLMVTLLLLHYRLSGEFPKTEHAFFGDLFDVLFRRHDQTKGLCRTKFTNASEFELKQLFCFSCYVSRKSGLVESHREKFISFIREAIDYYKKDLSPEGVLNDVMNGTNLLLEDGSNVRYSHKAIQEFYAAQFLMEQPDEKISVFFGNRIKKWHDWVQFLEFCEMINPSLFYKYFLIPHVGDVFFAKNEQRIDEGWIPSKRVLDKLFGDDEIGLRDSELVFYCSRASSKCYLLRHNDLMDKMFSAFLSFDWSLVPVTKDSRTSPQSIPHRAPKGTFYFTMREVLDKSYGLAVKEFYEKSLREKLGVANLMYRLVDHQQNQKDLFA